MGPNTLKAVHKLRATLLPYPWCVSVGFGVEGGRECVVVTTHVHVPSQHRWMIPKVYLNVPVLHRKIGSPSPNKGA